MSRFTTAKSHHTQTILTNHPLNSSSTRTLVSRTRSGIMLRHEQVRREEPIPTCRSWNGRRKTMSPIRSRNIGRRMKAITPHRRRPTSTRAKTHTASNHTSAYGRWELPSTSSRSMQPALVHHMRWAAMRGRPRSVRGIRTRSPWCTKPWRTRRRRRTPGTWGTNDPAPNCCPRARRRSTPRRRC